MLILPGTLAQQFNVFLDHQGLSRQNKSVCLKWLRFYWDFCAKYRHDPYLTRNLSPFLDKLRAKQQSELQLRQARQTVIRFYRLQSSVVNSVPTVTPIAARVGRMPTGDPPFTADSTSDGTAIAFRHTGLRVIGSKGRS